VINQCHMQAGDPNEPQFFSEKPNRWKNWQLRESLPGGANAPPSVQQQLVHQEKNGKQGPISETANMTVLDRASLFEKEFLRNS